MAILELRDGTPLWYSDQGLGRPIVLLQGLQFPAGYFWSRNVAYLARGARVLTLDLRGQGLSGKGNGPHTIEQCADDLAEFLDRMSLTRVCLAGVAFGAMVLLRYLEAAGTCAVRSVCIAEMTPRLVSAEGWAHPTFGEFPQAAAEAFAAGVRADRRAALDGFLRASFASLPDAASLAEMTAQTWLTPTSAVADLIDDMVRTDLRDVLPGIGLPTLLIYGRRNNPVMPGEIGRWMQAQIPGSELVELETAGHNVFWDDPDGFNGALASFAART